MVERAEALSARYKVHDTSFIYLSFYNTELYNEMLISNPIMLLIKQKLFKWMNK